MKYGRHVVFLLLLLPVPAAAQAPPAEWFHCTKAEDCVFAPGICNNNMVINRHFEKAERAMAATSTVSCGTVMPRLADAKPSCDEGICVMDVPGQYQQQQGQKQ